MTNFQSAILILCNLCEINGLDELRCGEPIKHAELENATAKLELGRVVLICQE